MLRLSRLAPLAVLLGLVAGEHLDAAHTHLNFPRQCTVEQAWPQGPGSALVAQPVMPDLEAILTQINTTNIENIINKLVSFGTRHTLSNQTDPVRGIGAARDWIAEQMRGFAANAHPKANVTVTVPSYTQTPVAGVIPTNVVISDVVLRIEGTSGTNRMYVDSGHYDSRVTNILNFEDDAPGADDDGSGVAVIMELARIMSTMPPPPATLIFTAVAGEEQGLFGADHLAGLLQAEGADVQGMFTNDIVGASKADNGFLDPNSIRLFAQGVPTDASANVQATLEDVGGENDSPARELARFVHEIGSNSVTNMTVRVIYREDRFLRGGDHEPFLERGFPATRFTEPNENFAHQHQDVRVQDGMQFGDLAEFCDFEFINRVARVNGAAMWSLANAPGTPKNATIDTSVLTNNSTLSWAADETGEVASYEIVWRPTIAPFWENVVPVGLVNKATVLLSKDNAIFGVRAVGANGYRSPAAFPFPST